MSYNIVLQAYERSVRAYEHCLPYNVPLREEPEESEKTKKIQEVFQQLENSCANITTCLQKIYEGIHNKEKDLDQTKKTTIQIPNLVNVMNPLRKLEYVKLILSKTRKVTGHHHHWKENVGLEIVNRMPLIEGLIIMK